MWNKITNPFNGNNVNINTKQGLKILKNYIKTLLFFLCSSRKLYHFQTIKDFDERRPLVCVVLPASSNEQRQSLVRLCFESRTNVVLSQEFEQNCI